MKTKVYIVRDYTEPYNTQEYILGEKQLIEMANYRIEVKYDYGDIDKIYKVKDSNKAYEVIQCDGFHIQEYEVE